MKKSNRILKLVMQMVLIVVVLLIVDALNTLLRGDRSGRGSISFTDSQITFLDASGETVVIPYSDVLSIELLEEPDYGEPVDGRVENDIRIGTWESDELGVYLSYTDTDIDSCLLLQTEGQTYAVNYENDETTAALLDELNKYC